jgi:hypothetical protein
VCEVESRLTISLEQLSLTYLHFGGRLTAPILLTEREGDRVVNYLARGVYILPYETGPQDLMTLDNLLP